MTNPADAKPLARHVSALHCRLLGALAMGCALGGCIDDGPAKRVPPSASTARVPPSGPCPYGDAGVVCYPQAELAEFVADGGYSEATVTAEGCVDSDTASEWVVPACEYPVSSGVRRDNECCYFVCSAGPGCGRPFVVVGEARLAKARASGEWVRAGTGEGELGADAAIAREWLRDALAEHASVAAFSAFNLSLLALGAPAQLVHAGASAALDEVYHARACFELASEYAGAPVGPEPLDMGELQIATDLESVVERAFLDGCIGETAAALVARASLDGCGAARARAALERIAEDEARHAELAWQFVAWAVQRGGEPIVRVLQRALERAESAERASDTCRASEVAPAEWRRAGRLSDAERASINRLALHDIARPMLDALLSQRRSPAGVEGWMASA